PAPSLIERNSCTMRQLDFRGRPTKGFLMPACRLFLVASLFVTSPAFAQEETLPDVEVHGFVSQGAIKSIRNNYLVPQSERGSFDVTEAAINFTKTVTDRLRLGVQLFGGGF